MVQRRVVLGVLLFVLIVAGAWAGVAARNAQVPPDATPGAVGFSGRVLAGIDVSFVPGYRLGLAESVFEPGAVVTRHIHPTAIVACVGSGAVGFPIQQGEVGVTRDGAEEAELLELNTDIVLEPYDCHSFDHMASHTSHTGWNASDQVTMLWEARQFKTDEPFTVYLNDEGTSVAP